MQQTPYCPIRFWQTRNPKSPALIGADLVLSYDELDEAINVKERALSNYFKPFLPLLAQTNVETITTLFAAFRLQLPLFLLSPQIPHEVRLSKITELETHFTREEEAIAIMIETSGSTGPSKIVCHTLEALQLSSRSGAEALFLRPGDLYSLNLPLHHIAGIAILLRTAISGATLAFPNAREQPTHISMVPTQLYRYMQSGADNPNLKCLLLGGAPCPPHIFEKAIARNLPIHTTYGMTETAAMATLKKPDDPRMHLGKPRPHLECAISADGEILLRGKALFSHYLGMGKRREQDWFPTRDLGELSDEGNLTVTGRKDRQFISGGENIQPEEIEQVLLSHPSILHAKVEPIEDEEFGFRSKAYVTLTESVPLEEISRYLEERLHKWKMPKELVESVESN